MNRRFAADQDGEFRDLYELQFDPDAPSSPSLAEAPASQPAMDVVNEWVGGDREMGVTQLSKHLEDQLYNEFMEWWPSSDAARLRQPEYSGTRWEDNPQQPITHWLNVEDFLRERYPEAATGAQYGVEHVVPLLERTLSAPMTPEELEAEGFVGNGNVITQIMLGLHNKHNGRTWRSQDDKRRYFELMLKHIGPAAKALSDDQMERVKQAYTEPPPPLRWTEPMPSSLDFSVEDPAITQFQDFLDAYGLLGGGGSLEDALREYVVQWHPEERINLNRLQNHIGLDPTPNYPYGPGDYSVPASREPYAVVTYPPGYENDPDDPKPGPHYEEIIRDPERYAAAAIRFAQQVLAADPGLFPAPKRQRVPQPKIQKEKPQPEQLGLFPHPHAPGIQNPFSTSGMDDYRWSDSLETDAMYKSIMDTYNASSEDVRNWGSQWYDTANEYVQNLAQKTNRSTEQVAAVMAALSPRTAWDPNMAQATHLLLHYDPANPDAFDDSKWPGLGENLARAKRILDGPGDHNSVLEALAGSGSDAPKITNFYKNIMGDKDAVTIDAWMARAILGKGVDMADPDLSSKSLAWAGAYDKMSDAVRRAAKDLGITPRELQAIVWTHVNPTADYGDMTPQEYRKREERKQKNWSRQPPGKSVPDYTKGPAWDAQNAEGGYILPQPTYKGAPGYNRTALVYDSIITDAAAAIRQAQRILAISDQGRFQEDFADDLFRTGEPLDEQQLRFIDYLRRFDDMRANGRGEYTPRGGWPNDGA